MSYKFAHIGVPTTSEQKNEALAEDFCIYLTDPTGHPYSFEYLRFVPGTPMPDILTKQHHVAFYVDNLEDAIKDEDVIVKPLEVSGTRSIAFIIKDGLPIELIQDK